MVGEEVGLERNTDENRWAKKVVWLANKTGKLISSILAGRAIKKRGYVWGPQYQTLNANTGQRVAGSF